MVGAVHAQPAGAPEAPRLSQRLAGAAVVVAGHVSRVQSFDDDRVRVIHLAVDRVVKGADRLGATGGGLEIVEMRDRATAPALLEPGASAVAFLRPVGGGSYLSRTLGPGRRWQASGGRDGILADSNPAVVAEAASLVDRLAEQSRAPAPTAEERERQRRAWTFDALAARHPALVEEGARSLPERTNASAPSEAELARLQSVLRREDLPPRIRAEVIDAIGDARIVSLLPALAAISSDEAVVLEASWRVRTALGSPPGRSEFERALRSPTPEVRSAAARAYVATLPGEGVRRMQEFFAAEPEGEVRIAVLEAVGPSAAEEATELLETAFVEDDELEVRQAAGRVLFARGGARAAESFGRLAFAASPEGQRHAVALLLALERPPDDPALVRVRAEHADPKVRDMLEHGFRDPHHHD